jgi:transposase InsO family protein
MEEFPFTIQAIQTDRGREFFAYSFQEKLMKYAIKFRPVRPASPHLNGKVERSQRTDLDEFYRAADLKSPDLSRQLEEWQDHYNQFRIHGSLNGRTPGENGFRLRLFAMRLKLILAFWSGPAVAVNFGPPGRWWLRFVDGATEA